MQPQRMCSVCRNRKEKGELIRVVKFLDGEIKIDLSGKLQGRGAYICKDRKCIEIAEKKRAFEHSFKSSAKKDLYKQLIELSDNNDY